MIELLEDVIGINSDGLVCHPYKITRGDKRGFFSYTLETDNNLDFKGTNEVELRALIEAGAFNERGRVRMIPAGSVKVEGGKALSVKRYNGIALPVR